jgi:hypothetical protein
VDVAGTGTPVIVSRTVATPETTDTVLIVAVDAATAEDGFVSQMTLQKTSKFKMEAVLSVISRPLAAENVVVATCSMYADDVEQNAEGNDPVNIGNPVMEIKLTALLASVPVNRTDKNTSADATLLLT